MKRIAILLAVLLILSGCGQSASPSTTPEPQTAAYTMQTYAESENIQSQLSLAGNGEMLVGADVSMEASTIYTLELSGDTVTATELSDSKGLRDMNLLAVDEASNTWISGHTAENHGVVLALDSQGNQVDTIDLGPEVYDWGIYGMTWDETYRYFLVNYRTVDGATLVVCDRTGTQVFSRRLWDYCQDTLGYLPMEAEWTEDLEGRDEDRLLSMLFPDGPVDDVLLSRSPNYGPMLLILRKSPIDAECYGLLCPIDPADFSITPRYYYPVDMVEPLRVTAFFESDDPGYDLLAASADGLLGLSIEDQSTTLLYPWEKRTALALTSGPGSYFCPWARGPGGSIVFPDMSGLQLDVLFPVT